MKAKNLAAIYIRVSTEDQAREGYSLEAQETALRKWCKENKYDIYDLYADRGISGKDIKNRPEMQRLLQDAAEHKFDTIVFWALSRFTRSVADLYATMEILDSKEVSLKSYTEIFDTGGPMGRAMVGIIGVFAQLERELISERISVALQVRASYGKRTCHNILGYDMEGKDSYCINPTEAKIVKYIFDMYIKTKNMSAVARLCTDQGFTGKRKAQFTAASVRNILMHPQYCGYNLYHGRIIKGSHPPIISPKEYNSIQKTLSRVTIGRKRSQDRAFFKLPEK